MPGRLSADIERPEHTDGITSKKNTVCFNKRRHILPPFPDRREEVDGANYGANRDDNPCDSEFAMQRHVSLGNQHALQKKDHHPCETEQAMDHEFGIAIAWLPDVPKQIVGKTPNRENEHSRTDGYKVLLCQMRFQDVCRARHR